MLDITTSLSIAQLQAATKAQIVSDVTSKMSKRDLIVSLVGADKVIDAPEISYAKDGQIERQVETIRDVETNEIVSTKKINWTYYERGEVDEITIIETDSKGKEVSRKVIKHYIDGRQPEVT